MTHKVDEPEFLQAIAKSRTWEEVSRTTGISLRNVLYRRVAIERRSGVKLSPGQKPVSTDFHTEALKLELPDEADIVLFGDAHVWPHQYETPAFQALLKVIHMLKPRLIIDMGDSFDGATVSRFPRRGWEQPPSLKEELGANLDFHTQITKAATVGCQLVWIPGNHCMRMANRLANAVPEFHGMPSTDLPEMFPEWRFANSVVINETLVCKHRYRQGVHAVFNNTLHAGVSIATGHLHRLIVRPIHDYRGLRYGIETGTLANIYGPQFGYTEDNPVDWCHGFVVVHVEGQTIWPEPIYVSENAFRFRGKTYMPGE